MYLTVLAETKQRQKKKNTDDQGSGGRGAKGRLGGGGELGWTRVGHSVADMVMGSISDWLLSAVLI